MNVDLDLEIKVAVYQHFAETGARPTVEAIAARAGVSGDQVIAAFGRLRAQRVLVLEPDGRSIRMAPPFSGVPTPHVVESGGVSSFANCAWDAFGIAAALGRPAMVRSSCGQSAEPLTLGVSLEGPEACDWVFHCAVPAAHWWDDIVFT